MEGRHDAPRPPGRAIVMIDYDEDTEIGRSVVYQRAVGKDDPKGYEEYV